MYFHSCISVVVHVSSKKCPVNFDTALVFNKNAPSFELFLVVKEPTDVLHV